MTPHEMVNLMASASTVEDKIKVLEIIVNTIGN